MHRPARGSCVPVPKLFAPCARLSGPPSVFPLCHTSEGEFPPLKEGLTTGALTRRAAGGAGGCRTRTFAALAQPRAFRRCSFPDELPAPCSAYGFPFRGCPRPRCYAPSVSHARSKGMTSTFPQSTGSGRRRVSSHAVSCGSSSSGVFRRTTA